MENGQWRMDNGEWTMENGQWTMVNGQWSMDNGQWRMILAHHCYMRYGREVDGETGEVVCRVGL